MKRLLLIRLVPTLFVLLALLPAQPVVSAVTRIKDIASVKGVRGNALMGYGLVVGLNKTGDRRQTLFSNQSLAAMLERLGTSVAPRNIKVENVAAVVVTAELPAFAQPGTSLDVTVSSIGDAKSLQGGVLLMTPLRGPDNEVYALAQGGLTLGGFGAGGGGNSVQVNHLTVGRVPGGGVVERPAPKVSLTGHLEIVLDFNDFTTASRLATAVNTAISDATATPMNGRTVAVTVPDIYVGREVEFIAALETLSLDTDVEARVVINERTGTIVMGANVRISSVAVAHGGLSVRVDTQFNVSQPAPFTRARGAETVVVPDQQLDTAEEEARVMALGEGATISELIQGLNTIGATPRDIIAILQALKAAGALQADLQVL